MNPEKLFNNLKKHPKANNSIQIQSHNISLDLSFTRIAEETFQEFELYSKQLNLTKTLESGFNINTLNSFEKKSVNHHQLRSGNPSFYTEQHQRLLEFIKNINNENTKYLNNIKNVIQIGIGGSNLGPNAIYNALSTLYIQQQLPQSRKGYFISNLDPLNSLSILDKINLKQTLFIIVSKSGNTMETIENYKLIKSWWLDKKLPTQQLKEHCIAITTKNSNLDNKEIAAHHFYIDETIGGRFSVTSPVGTCIIGLCFSTQTINSLLKGAKTNDLNSTETNIYENIALCAAWELVYQRTVCNYPARVITAYSHALRNIPQHIQQLSCESNGKATNLQNCSITYPTAPIIISAIGTNSQHSFFQLIHQGTDIIPVEFIYIEQPYNKNSIFNEMHHKLIVNLKAQMKALLEGSNNSNPNKLFQGDRPSIAISLKKLSAESLGELIAFYENKTMFEGLIWNINSFDQEGVELGKNITNQILSKEHNYNL